MTASAPTVFEAPLRVPPPPTVALRSRVARRLLVRAVRRLPEQSLTVRDSDGSLLVRGVDDGPELHILRDAFYHRLGAAGKIGFGEAYMAGEWAAVGDLASVLRPFAANLERLIPPLLQKGRRLVEPLQPRAERNTIRGAARNIRRHYDLSNELFALFLDETMTYSCAVFAPGESLEQAQVRKYRMMAELADVRPGHRVLEIGTGWGGMAVHLAATLGCPVTTITLSQEQAGFARDRVVAADLEDLVDVRLCDYREVDGCFDRIVSIEMFEAVGERYWPEFFAVCDARLAPGGRMAMQTITMPHDRYRASRRSYGWIHKYIFPGGLIPSRQAIGHAARRASDLRVTRGNEIGRHYEATLHTWRTRFMANVGAVRTLGFDEPFVRMWELYLAYCEAGFATEQLGNAQLLLERV